MNKLKCYIIAGELSGDKLGASLIDGLIEAQPTNLVELIKVKGMGKQKVALYGEEILDLIRQ